MAHELVAPLDITALHVAGDLAGHILEELVHDGQHFQRVAVHDHVFQFDAGDLEQLVFLGLRCHSGNGQRAATVDDCGIPIFSSMQVFNEPMMAR